MTLKYSLLFVVFLLGIVCPTTVQGKERTFTVVIDPGHGGKDPGAIGFVSQEKVINLAVSLKFGALIKKHHPQTNIIYTRKADRFIELNERANIANRAKADLFISIHTNAVSRGSSVRGTETFTLGLSRTDENLAVAMRENSAILLEDNYLQKYEGFDPRSSESYIIFEFTQNKHVEQSVSLASEIQKAFAQKQRGNRGVRQAGLLVLRKTSMPSVLVELGFISNREEERFMRSSAGQNKLADALYRAFTTFKREYDRKQGNLSSNNIQPATKKGKPSYTTDSPQKKSSNKGKMVYRVQILTSGKKLPSNSKHFKGYKNIHTVYGNGLYKYSYGESLDFNQIKQVRKKILKDFKDAFIVAYKDGKRVKY
jgi:N-acetylmuramoyl-L-alanine amidase